ncbi:hypothetical protein FisN_21Lu075 [Fistulifera solaris]|uniref:(S)-ureidoglycine aminohydrolase cupin domain-containing protein n=1 Tax=Fistulifera solaris TaxID=1519565 RepID=A0A1Z5KK34_FISSO|nr:hypothetical protein FisN_21Lu075 [Fistulifera solaris]|eukprot:GAX26567.1 hypothetical protein FisN_21Lu075 [Fistulifera solaris]
MLLLTASSFAPVPMNSRFRPQFPFFMVTSEKADLIRFTTPCQSEAESLGIREWPQQARSKGSFEEVSREGQTLVRYVLDGEAKVTVVKQNIPQKETFIMRPGSLLEVRGEAKLTWQVESEEMILLTPSFEQLGLFTGVILGFVMVMGALIASN